VLRGTTFALLAFLFAVLPAAAADPLVLAGMTCTSQNPAFIEDDPSGFISPCAALPGTLIVETLYSQNASRLGGTALAAYPLVRLRTGVLPRLELVLDPPSQIAESGLRGLGLYPITRFGYGADYTIASNGTLASGFGVEVQPPSSLFNVDERQPKYIFDITAGYRVGRATTVSAIATGSSSHLVGFGRIAPAAAIRTAFDAGSRTQLSTDLGERVVARGARAQAFGDFALHQRLHKNSSFVFGLGTTFNGFVNAGKAHYMAAGFNFHLK
jgi:hypothetical protein